MAEGMFGGKQQVSVLIGRVAGEEQATGDSGEQLRRACSRSERFGMTDRTSRMAQLVRWASRASAESRLRGVWRADVAEDVEEERERAGSRTA
jgi:hypothetical protein